MQVGGHLAKLSLESLGRLRDSISSGKVGPELQALARATGTGAPALLVDQGVREQVQQRCQDQGLPGYGSAPRSVQNLTEGGLKAGATLGHQASLSAFIQDTSVPIEKRILGRRGAPPAGRRTGHRQEADSARRRLGPSGAPGSQLDARRLRVERGRATESRPRYAARSLGEGPDPRRQEGGPGDGAG